MSYIETEKVELKRVLNETFVREIVAFLNSHNGTIYIGVEDDGNVVGVNNVDKLMKEISDIITDKILPDCKNLIHPSAILEDGKMIVKVEVTKGNSLYYIKRYGRSASGCYVRIGTTCKSMSADEIEKGYIKTLNIPKLTIIEMVSPRQDLTFDEFKTILAYKHFHYNELSFNQNFSLLNSDDKFNYLAYLLSDQNSISIKVCKFKGTTKVDFLSRKEFDDGCILRKMEEAFDYADNVINLIQTDVSGGNNRVDTPLLDKNSFKEAWYNAVCHNLWTSKIPPAIYGFEDRVEIISQGVLRDDLTKEEFFNGVSKPVNEELANIFLKL